MGPTRRGRKSLHPPPVRTPLKELDLNSNSVPLPDTAPTAPAGSQPNAVAARDLASVPGTPTQENAVVNLPTRPDTPTGINTPSWSATATESHTPRERSPERAQGKDNGAPSKGPVDSPGNPFSTSSPATLTAVCDPMNWLNTPVGRTRGPPLDRAMDDLRCSRYGLWIGNPSEILKHCSWMNAPGRSAISTLQWNPDSSSRLAHDEGDAIIGFIGTVSVDNLTVGPEGGWLMTWGDEDKFSKHKRGLRIVCPGPRSNVPLSYWSTQFAGATRLIEDGCRASGETVYDITHSFANKPDGYLRIRSPLFLKPPPAVQHDDSDDSGSDAESDASEEAVPADCQFPTWDVKSRDVRGAFDYLIGEGYVPQVLQAYTRSNKIIHPNNVTGTLSGAIVLVNCTLERARFTSKEGKTEFQFYANLVKVQVLKLAPPVKLATTCKRKHIHSYGPDDGSGSDGRSSDKPAAKRPKLVSAL